MKTIPECPGSCRNFILGADFKNKTQKQLHQEYSYFRNELIYFDQQCSYVSPPLIGPNKNFQQETRTILNKIVNNCF